jgi:hypothetical protein
MAGEHKESKNNTAGNLEQKHHIKQLQFMKQMMNFLEHYAMV